MSLIKITRETLANQLSKEFGIAYSITYKKIDTILNIWSLELLNSDLTINSIGSFKINHKNSRLGRNPKTKEKFEIRSRKVVTFKKSKKMEL